MKGRRTIKSYVRAKKACDIFESARGSNREAKERNACIGCDLFPTKKPEGKRNHASLERLTEEAWQIRTERMAGYPRDRNKMRMVAFYTLQMIEQMIEQDRIVREAQLKELLMAKMGLSIG